MDAAQRRALEAEVAKHVLDDREQQLLARVAQGKSLRALAELYRGVYEGENGVMHAINEARRKVREAINGKRQDDNATASAAAERPLDAHLAPDEDEDDGGIPVRSVPAGTVTDAGAAQSSPPAAPPTAPRQLPSSAPEKLPAVRDSPAPASRASNAEVAKQREGEVLAVLADGPANGRDILAAMQDCPKPSLYDLLSRMYVRGQITRSHPEHSAREWLYALPGMVSSQKPPPTAPVTTSPARPRPEKQTPPPFAGIEPEPDPSDPAAPTLAGLQLRYIDTLVTGLEAWLETGDELPVELCDRIERLLGAGNGVAEQPHALASAGGDRD